VKLAALVTVIPVPETFTEIGPVVAPGGTVADMLVDVALVTTASVPLNRTSLFAGVVLKLDPVMVTQYPDAPLAGAKPSITGFGTTVKSWVLITVSPPTVTETGPVVAPAGTVADTLFVVAPPTAAIVPLNRTSLLAGVSLKPEPEIVTDAPSEPLAGLNPEMPSVMPVELSTKGP
jgi:hypothetical protein